MTKIIRFNETPTDFVKTIKDKDLLIYEDVQGARIFVKYDGKDFTIKPKSIKNDELNFVDLAVQKFYSSAFRYLYNLPDYVLNLLSPSWWFCFEYFPDNQPAHIEYKKIPKNNLILTCIVKGSRYKYDYSEIVEYSKLFDVDPLPVIFKGKLSDTQMEVIEMFLNTSEEDLDFVFGEENFAYFFYKILNPKEENSFLMEDFNDNMEKIIIKIKNNDEFSFEILNPLHQKMKLTSKTEYLENFSLILLNFLEFLQLYDYKNSKLRSITKEELYVEFMSLVFNEYIKNIEKEIIDWNISIPHFFTKTKFRINVDLLKNRDTRDYMKSSSKIEYLFKVILGSFNKKRKKPIGIFNEKTVDLFNNEVDQISNYLDDILKINREYTIQKQDLLNFKDYFKVNYSTDADGDIYPDVYDTFMDDIEGEDKKKKGKKGKYPGGVPEMPKKKDQLLF